jgi:hypothetical protein
MPRKTRKKKVMSAREHDAAFRAGMKRIDAHLRRIDEIERQMAPKLRELRKFVNKKGI